MTSDPSGGAHAAGGAGVADRAATASDADRPAATAGTGAARSDARVGGAAAAEAAPRRWLWPWDAYLLVCLTVVTVLVARVTDTAPPGREVAVVCLVLMIVGWVAVGRRTAREDGDESSDSVAALGFIAAVTVLFAVAVVAHGMSTFALFALCPAAFLCLTLRSALIVVTVLNLTPLAAAVIRGMTFADLRVQIGIAVLGLTFSALIGTSIERITRESAERARLVADLEASRGQVAALSHEAGIAAERARLAAEIHDTLAQGFTSIVTLVQAAESELDTDRPAADRHLALAVRTARENLAEARAMVAALGPVDLRAGTLADAVRRQVDRFAAEAGVTVDCAVENLPTGLPTAVEVVLLRALQESLTNVRKHARAGSVTVDLGVTAAGTVTLVVADDGVGFDEAAGTGAGPATATGETIGCGVATGIAAGSGSAADAPADGGYGLRGMRVRAAQAGGILTVHSVPGRGTTVELELPI